MCREPLVLFDLAQRYIERILAEDPELFSSHPTGFAEIRSALEGMTAEERASVSLLWATFNFCEIEGHETTEAYLLGAMIDLLDEGKIGVGSIGPDGATRVRVWSRRDRERWPRLAELETLMAYLDSWPFPDTLVPDSLRSAGDLDRGFDIDGPLCELGKNGLLCLRGAGCGIETKGVLHLSTARVPLPIRTFRGGLMREWDEAPLLLEGLDVSLRSQEALFDELRYRGPGYRSFRPMGGVIGEDWGSGDEPCFDAPHPWLRHRDDPGAGGLAFTPGIDAFARHFVRAVNRFLHRLIPTKIELFLVNDRGVLEWRASNGRESDGAPIVPSTGRRWLPGLPFEALSAAERRWARFAIRFCDRFLDRVIDVLGEDDERTWVSQQLARQPAGLSPECPGYLLLVDEPEAGLHRSAEPVLARTMAELTQWCGVKVIVATHSPAFVREFTAIGGHVYRTHEGLDGKRVVEECRFVDLESTADAIGLDPVEVLQLVRLFVFVEGEHDKTILDEMFGDDFARYGVYVVALRGARGLSQVAQANVLWNVTDAPLVVVLDAIKPELVAGLLEEARQRFLEGSPGAALAVLRRLDDEQYGPSTERKALQELFFEAVRTGRLGRIHCDGLPERDILHYLDSRSLVSTDDLAELEPNSARWKALAKAWRRDTKGRGSDFKSWLVATYPGTAFDEVRLRRAVHELDHVPADLKGLFARIVSLIDDSPVR